MGTTASIASRVGRNVAALSVGRGLNLALNFAFTIIAVRYLGSVGYGKLSFALVTAHLFFLILNPGLQIFSIGEVAKDRTLANRYLCNLLALRCGIGMVAYGCLLTAVAMLGYPTETQWVVGLIGLSMVLGTGIQTFSVVFRAFERMEYEVLAEAISLAFKLILGTLVLVMGLGVVALAAVYCLTSFLTTGLLGWLFVRTFFVPRLDLDLAFCRRIFTLSLPIGAGIFFFHISDRIDIVMLSLMRGDAAVGLYNVAYQALKILHLVPGIVMGAFFPLMARSYIEDKELMQRMMNRVYHYLLALVVPLVIGGFILGDELFIALYGETFAASAGVFKVLIWTALVSFLVSPCTFLLIVAEERRKYVFYHGIGVGPNILLNMLLIPWMGITGAAVATVVTDFFTGGLIARDISRNLLRIAVWPSLKKVGVASAVMGWFVYWAQGVNVFLVILAAVVIYSVVFCFLKGVPSQDLRMFWSLLSAPAGFFKPAAAETAPSGPVSPLS